MSSASFTSVRTVSGRCSCPNELYGFTSGHTSSIWRRRGFFFSASRLAFHARILRNPGRSIRSISSMRQPPSKRPVSYTHLKFARTGYHASKSALINAPIIDEFPVVMECELAGVCSTDSFYAIVGRIVNTAAEDTVLSENGKIDPSRLKMCIRDRALTTEGETTSSAYSA